MKKEHKEILLKDLCSRLPYGVKADKYTIRIDGEFVPIANIEIVTAKDILARNECPGYTIKPYLFPLSSMTEEQKKEYYNLCIEEEREEIEFGEWITRVYYHNTIESIDWLNKNHFDYRGLIPMGLAIDATNINIY